ncbi:MAG: hypothetical protein CYPHOPRED_001560 [Cyphobasidiales sp. Tagirdzhanova-0007]|nr:MAG: hypothetical protein CYPHOPRED_001560 [Cyphobasidiales sp. Tagirdzhanova-0007]
MNVRWSRSIDWPSKRIAVFYLANLTLKIYFKLNNLRLCDTVVKNTRDARDYLDSQYPKADRVTFYYYMGRMYLYQRRMRKAMLQFRKAFELCTSRHYKNRRLILIYLVTASLPLGVFPAAELLAAFDLQNQYGQVIEAVKAGNYRQCRYLLDQWQDWHLAKGTYLILREKLEVICWRNLARKTLFIAHSGQPQSGTGPPTLPFKTFLATAKFAFNDSTLELDDIEAMCASLLDQGYVKAYIHHAMQLLVLQKGNLLGFPRVNSVRMIGDEA